MALLFRQEKLYRLTLLVCLDEKGEAHGTLYWDEGDNWSFKDGNYSFQHFTAIRTADNKVQVKITQKKGKYITENNDMAIVKIITDKGIYQASGNLVEGIEVQL